MTEAHPKLAPIRAQISKLAEEIEGLREGVQPESEALAAVDRHVDKMAASVRVDPWVFAHGTGHDPVSMHPEESHAYACRFFPEVIRSQLHDEVKALYKSGLTVADHGARQKMEAQLLDLEHQEEALIRQAAAEGKSIPRRAEANPAVLLAD